MSNDQLGTDPLVMSLDLNILNHLGLRLYSNVPAVLSEAVANAWDADAEHVQVKIINDKVNGNSIVISDDGHGMSREDVQGKYLKVGYERRKDNRELTPKHKRKVMGRKGIGKLSLLSIAESVEVHTKEKDGEPTALRMTRDDIEAAVGANNDYLPQDLSDSTKVEFEHGTRIILKNLKKSINTTPKNLRQRLARRFTVIRPQDNFEVLVDDKPIGFGDRNYFYKLEYAWWYDDKNDDRQQAANGVVDNRQENRSLIVRVGDEGTQEVEYQCNGWIGTARKSGTALEEDGESLNKLSLVVRGKVAHENLLSLLGETGVYSSYLIGEIEADFLDVDDDEDIATSNRQQINESDPRFQALQAAVRNELKHIQSKWNEWRQEDGIAKASKIPCISEWIDSLGSDAKKSAGKIFGLIHKVTSDDPDKRIELYKQSIVAFETLRARDQLSKLDQIADQNINDVLAVLKDLDDLEASKYYSIVKERVHKIEHLLTLHETPASEAEVQKYLFEHHWLIDPSWERATEDDVLERNIGNLNENQLDELFSLTDKQKRQRVDIKFRFANGRHVIVELKKPDVTVSFLDIYGQSERYLSAVKNVLRENGCEDDRVELVFLIGKEVRNWDNKDTKAREKRNLKEIGVAVYYYPELVNIAYDQNQAFLEANADMSRVSKLLDKIEIEEQALKKPEITVVKRTAIKT